MPKPLSGVRALDLSLLLPGPFCAQVLRGLGAQVTKVELPQMPDRARSIGNLFARVNQGKKVLSFDYSKASGKKRLLALVGRSDILVEGFRPGLLDRLGLGPKDLLKQNPRLIYCSITGYGRQGSRRGGHDLNYEALAGLLSDGTFPQLPAADLSGSLYAVIQILAALRERDRSDQGRLIDISMTDSARSLNFPELQSLLKSSPFYRLYPCRDGLFIAVAALERSPALWLLKQLNLEHLETATPKTIASTLAQTFKKKTRAEWTRLLGDQEVCVTPALNPAEARAR